MASSNAILAGIAVNEAFKTMTGASLKMKNYLEYEGLKSTGTKITKTKSNKECLICSRKDKILKLKKFSLLMKLVEMFKEDPRYGFKNFSLKGGD